MSAAMKFEHAKKRIELMLEEIKLIGFDVEEIVEESQDFHLQHFTDFDILDRDQRLAERSASDRLSDALSLRGSVSQLRANLESEVRNLRDRTAFERVS
jgi:hypothetical protein